MQEVFLILWRNIGKLILDVDPRPWLYAVAFYRAGNYRHSCRYTRECLIADGLKLGTVEVDPGGMMDAYRSFVRIMRRLSKKLRDVFVAVVLEGQSIEEVAASLRIPTKTAESRLYLARGIVQRVGAM